MSSVVSPGCLRARRLLKAGDAAEPSELFEAIRALAAEPMSDDVRATIGEIVRTAASEIAAHDLRLAFQLIRLAHA